jgi:glyoxylase-like metal-dependent hydrolase (beta-lactamase superfamily II)
VLVGEERVYVVDPATYEAEERERLFDAIERWCKEGRSFDGVLVTHHHRDHVGSVVETARRFGLPVLAHRETLSRLDLDGAEVRELRDGDALELGRAPDGRPGWRLCALHTPGHAPGHLAFVEDRYRSAIAGDLVSTLSTIVIDPEDGHLATYLASLRKLVDFGIACLHPAHGPAVLDGPGLLRRYLEHRAEREAALVAALEHGLDTVEALVPRVYSDTPEAMHALAARSLLSGLLKLEEDGRARRSGERWRVR